MNTIHGNTQFNKEIESQKMHCCEKAKTIENCFSFSYLTINLTLTSGSCIPDNQKSSKYMPHKKETIRYDLGYGTYT